MSSTYYLQKYKTHNAFDVVASQFIKQFGLNWDIINLLHESIRKVEDKRKRTWTLTLTAALLPTKSYVMKFVSFRYRNICDILSDIDFEGNIHIDPNDTC